MTDHERGATVTEVLVVLAVSGIITVALVLALTRGVRTETNIIAELERDRWAARVTERMIDDLRESELDSTTIGSLDLSRAIALRTTDETEVEQALFWSVESNELSRRTTNVDTGRTGVVVFGAASSLEVRYVDANDRDIRLSDPSDAACIRLIEVRIERPDQDPVLVAVAPRLNNNPGASC